MLFEILFVIFHILIMIHLKMIEEILGEKLSEGYVIDTGAKDFHSVTASTIYILIVVCS